MVSDPILLREKMVSDPILPWCLTPFCLLPPILPFAYLGRQIKATAL
jgi:hypothetical protein